MQANRSLDTARTRQTFIHWKILLAICVTNSPFCRRLFQCCFACEQTSTLSFQKGYAPCDACSYTLTHKPAQMMTIGAQVLSSYLLQGPKARTESFRDTPQKKKKKKLIHHDHNGPRTIAVSWQAKEDTGRVMQQPHHESI